MVNSEEFIGTAEYQALQTRYRINQCRYNRVRFQSKWEMVTEENHDMDFEHRNDLMGGCAKFKWRMGC